jgi:OOP family OmpA-OmpF porin
MKRRIRAMQWTMGVIACLVGATVPSARGQYFQSSGYAINQYEPSERGSEWFVLDSLDFRGHMRPAIGVTGDWAYRPLIIENTDGSVRASTIQNQVFAHVGASLLLWERLRLGVNLPVQVYNNGKDGFINGVEYREANNSQSVGDLRLAADVRLLGEHTGPFTMALGVRGWLPTGARGSWTGDGEFRIAPQLLIAGEAGLFTYGLKGGYMYRHQDMMNGTFAGAAFGDSVFYGAAAGLRLANRKLVIGPEFFGSTVVENSGAFKALTTPAEVMLGTHYTIGDSFRVGAGISKGLTKAFGTPNVRGLLSLEYVAAAPVAAAPADRDGDGVADAEDACPDVAGVRTSDPATNGCPAVVDRDNDGVLDAEDACPDVAGIRTEDPRTNGCPADRDGDGVADAEDACPDVPGVRTEDPKTNGCPADRDGDGVTDNEDACPDAAGLRTEDPKTNGCPDPDRDKDGIANEQDACPDEAGKENADPKKNGCPMAFIKDNQIKILEQVKFKTNSARIVKGPEGEGVLEAVLQVLVSHPEIKKVRVEGHTDSTGPDKRNMRLSAQRAKSVATWLTKHGIAKDRITSEGLGETRPIDTNDTEDGRKNNRRVEFHIEQQEAPTTSSEVPVQQ